MIELGKWPMSIGRSSMFEPRLTAPALYSVQLIQYWWVRLCSAPAQNGRTQKWRNMHILCPLSISSTFYFHLYSFFSPTYVSNLEVYWEAAFPFSQFFKLLV